MHNRHSRLHLLPVLFLTATAFGLPRHVMGQDSQQANALAAFQAALRENDQIDDQSRDKALQMVDSLRNDDPTSREIIAAALRQLYPEFTGAMESLEAERYDDAMDKLKALTENNDPFLATESSYFLARCHMDQENYEEALPALRQVTKDENSLRSGEALFLRGVCQSNLLHREDAIASFADFLRMHPHASERERVGAWRQIQLLTLVEEGTLHDVYSKMAYSRRRLSLTKSDEPTQNVQGNVISILEKLIKEAEEREAVAEGEGTTKQVGQRKGKGAGRGEGPGGGGDDQTPFETVRKVQKGTQRSPWDHLRDKQRDARALAAIKEKYPARYRQLIEQYYRSLQEDPDQ